MFRKAYAFNDVQLVPRYYNGESRKDVSTATLLGPIKLDIPIISANMDSITGASMATEMHNLGGLGILHRFCSIEENVSMLKDVPYFCGVSIGVNDTLRIEALYAAGARVFCVDVAHGHSKLVRNTIKELKQYVDITIIAGNVCDRSGAEYLAGCGADIIKVGVGPGSVCTTRIKTGHGVPQLTAVMDCCKAGKPVIADGGMKAPGDVVKALAAGANAVMIGGMFAGCDETPGEIMLKYGDVCVKASYKKFRGMASKEANDDMFGGLTDWKTAEGVEKIVPCKGPVANVIQDIIGGLRSGMTYSGAFTIKELQEKAEFVEITTNGYTEGTSHYGN